MEITKKSSAFVKSSKFITISGCKKIEKYSSDEIIILLTNGLVHICGNKLDLATFSNSYITVKGIIKDFDIKFGGENEA